MTIRRGIFALVIAVLIALGGWYIFMHNQSLPHVLNASGDRQISETTDYYTIQAVYPNETRLATRTDAGSLADRKAEAAIETTVNGIIASFKSDANQALTPDEKTRLAQQNLKYALDITYHSYNSGSFVSEELDIYEDTGGAHPINSYKTLVFDLNGNQVQLSSLFSPGADYLAPIAAAAKAQVLAQLAQNDGADATSSLISEGVAANADNFANWVDDQGILTIFIPPYQAAAYAAGSFTVHIPLTDLQSILKPGIQ